MPITNSGRTQWITARAVLLAVLVIAIVGTVAVAMPAAAQTDETSDENASPESFTAYGQQGEIVLNEPEAQPEDTIVVPECDEDQPLPSNAPDLVTWEESCFEINGEINDDGTWTAGPDDITFPEIYTEDVDYPATDATVQMSAPDGLSGTIDTETGEVTVDGALEIEVEINAAIFGISFGDTCTTSMELEATTGESENGMTGEQLTIEDGTATGTIVDDRFSVPAIQPADSTVCSGGNDTFYLPSESGLNSFNLDVWVEFDG